MQGLKHGIFCDLCLNPALLTYWQCDFMDNKRVKHPAVQSIKWWYQCYISLITSSTFVYILTSWNRDVCYNWWCLVIAVSQPAFATQLTVCLCTNLLPAVMIGQLQAISNSVNKQLKDQTERIYMSWLLSESFYWHLIRSKKHQHQILQNGCQCLGSNLLRQEKGTPLWHAASFCLCWYRGCIGWKNRGIYQLSWKWLRKVKPIMKLIERILQPVYFTFFSFLRMHRSDIHMTEIYA